jgi:hypothetical protein
MRDLNQLSNDRVFGKSLPQGEESACQYFSLGYSLDCRFTSFNASPGRQRQPWPPTFL